MKPNETELFAELERLGAHCPWEQVDIWTCRQPEGNITFTAYAEGIKKLEVGSAWGRGSTPKQAVDQIISEHPDRGNLEEACNAKIAKLEMDILKLKGMSFALPPYKPTPLIGVSGAPEPPPAPAEERAIEVETVTVTKEPSDAF